MLKGLICKIKKKHNIDLFVESDPGEMRFVFKCKRCGFVEQILYGKIERGNVLTGDITLKIYDKDK